MVPRFQSWPAVQLEFPSSYAPISGALPLFVYWSVIPVMDAPASISGDDVPGEKSLFVVSVSMLFRVTLSL